MKKKQSLGRVFDYLQTNPDNPVIQAGIVQIQIIHLMPFADGNGRTARLMGYLFLAKYGYDFRNLVVLEEYWRRDLVALREATASAAHGELSQWLDYFALGVLVQLKHVVDTLETSASQIDTSPSLWKLNSRQKEILSILSEPRSKITNREVQKLFRISQVTASRDLSKMAGLELLFSRGRGRSTHYTRV